MTADLLIASRLYPSLLMFPSACREWDTPWSFTAHHPQTLGDPKKSDTQALNGRFRRAEFGS